MSISVGGLPLGSISSANASTLFFGSLALVALVAGWLAGAVRPARIDGPPRLSPDTRVLPLATVLFGSFGFYLFAYSAMAQLWPWISNRLGFGNADLAHSEAGVAAASCIPPLVGLLGMFVGDRAIFPVAGQKLGMSARFIPRGFMIGFLASFIVMPLMLLSSDVVERTYRTVHYEHPQEHPLLQAMGESPSLGIRAALVLGACLIAPIWEEAFFRGHLQTVLRSGISRLFVGSSSLRSRVAISWTAVLLTSGMFAMLHPAWSAPMIFLLAICLGYAYERTANLWVSITLHAIFNSFSTFWFLTHGVSN